MKGKNTNISFFDRVMRRLNILPTTEKRKFFRAWQQAENTNAKYNPLATTMDINASGQTDFNSVGVKNYPTEDDGVDATVKTLQLDRYYKELTDKLKRDDITAEELAQTTGPIATWSGGNGTYIAKRLGINTNSTNTQSTHKISTNSKTISNWKRIKEYIANNFAEPVLLDNNRIRFKHENSLIVINRNGIANIFNTNTRTKTKESWILSQSGDKLEFNIGNQLYTPSKVSSSIEDADEWEVIDYIQLAMDFLGFIPVIGDAIDLINALIYFYREKWIDGILSLIAVIPVVGSFIKLGLKGTFKAVGAARASRSVKKAIQGNPADFSKLLSGAVNQKQIDRLQLKQLEKFFGDTGIGLLRKSKSKIKSYESSLKTMGVPAEKVLTEFDKFEDIFSNLKSATTLAAKQTSKTSKAVSNIAKSTRRKTVKFFDGLLTIGTLGTWRIVKSIFKLFNMRIGRLQQLADGLKSVYKRKLRASNILSAQMAKANKTIPPQLSAVGIKSSSSSNEIKIALDKLKNVDPKEHRRTINAIADQSADSNNPFYRLFIDNEIRAAANVIKPGDVVRGTADGTIVNILRQMKFGVKSLDVLSNEFQAAAAAAGITMEDGDDPKAVILPAITAGVLWVIGDSDSDEPTTDPKQVFSSQSEINQIKQAYEDASGNTPIEKTKILADEGWSQIKIWALSKILGFEL